MKSNNQQLYGLILILFGIIIVVSVSAPIIGTLIALCIGFYMIHSGLLLRGGPSLLTLLRTVMQEVYTRLFK